MNDRETNPLFTFEEDRPSTRGRETFLASIVLHLLIVLLIVTHPEFFDTSRENSTRLPSHQQKDVTMLYEPPKLPKMPKLKAPPRTQISSEATRRTEKRMTEPVSPPAARPAPAPVKPSEPPQQSDTDKMAKQIPPIGNPKLPEPPKEPPKQRPTLEQIPKSDSKPSQAQMTISPIVPPIRGTDSILRGLAQDEATGKLTKTIQVPLQDSGPNEMKLNIPGPQILSDTMGVDFNPYLLRILTIVRRNWSTVIPEIARLGRPGRVVLQFTIEKNGGVPDLALTGGSGTESLDSAALSSIRLSNPFPPLPPEFPGQEVKLRFLFLYNMKGE